jgi:parvulin-like peptidyl-prolyl isomerase
VRQVAVVAGRSFDRDDVRARETILLGELARQAEALVAESGDGSDPLLEQQMQALSAQAETVTQDAADSLLTGAVLAARAADFGIEVTGDEIEAELDRRATKPERVVFSVIAINALPADAEPGAEPTAGDFFRSRGEAQAARARVDAGEDFAAVAAELSDDPSATGGGAIGPVFADDEQWAFLFEAAAGLEPGSLLGPVQSERGHVVARVESRDPETRDEEFIDRFRERGVSEDALRAFVHDELLVEEFRAHFRDEVLAAPQEQRRVAQILVRPADPNAPAAEGVMQRLVRHVLIQPLPETQDQTTATEEQWTAALARAEAVREQLEAEDADWWTIAEEESGDRGSASRGGSLGWVDPLTAPFVEAFRAEVANLAVGDISEPVRTEFGYHLIQVTDERTSVAEEIETIRAVLADDPDAFGELARRLSEDAATARDGGELGWVVRYELPEQRETVIFGLPEAGAVSDPLEVTGVGTYFIRLLEINPRRQVEAERLDELTAAGFDRWLDEQWAGVETWIDIEFQPAAETAGG